MRFHLHIIIKFMLLFQQINSLYILERFFVIILIEEFFLAIIKVAGFDWSDCKNKYKFFNQVK